MLDHADFSVGEIDGRMGKNTITALEAYQAARLLPTTGLADDATLASLRKTRAALPLLITIRITRQDLSRQRYLALAATPSAQARQRCMCYESAIEMLAERHHSSPKLLRALNRSVTQRGLKVGDRLTVPNAGSPKAAVNSKVVKVRVMRAGPAVQGLDARGKVVFHAPASVGADYGALVGKRFAVTMIVPNPEYDYRPERFGNRASKRVALPAGPNAPVGAIWIGLSMPHLGLHGTPHPEAIAYGSSHGCVRMTNADAQRLASLITVGLPVEFR
jgi:lipoprotein-anchoring transpeptidase ErfK/SrfK